MLIVKTMMIQFYIYLKNLNNTIQDGIQFFTLIQGLGYLIKLKKYVIKNKNILAYKENIEVIDDFNCYVQTFNSK